MNTSEKRTLRSLLEDMPCTIAELGRQAGVNEVTIARIRDGKPARRATVNKLLMTLSKVYGEQLTTRNVGGIVFQGEKITDDAA